MKNQELTPGTLGTVKVGRKVIVKGLDINCNEVLTSMTVIENGINTILKGKDGVAVKVDGNDTEFWIDLPLVRKNLKQRIL